MRKTPTLFSLTTFLSLVIISTVFVHAAPGDLDTTFGTGGKMTIDINGNDTPQVVKIQPDGKILVAGSSGALVLARYNADGTTDTSYGTNGKIISSDPQTAFTVGAFQPDGKLVTVTNRTPFFAEAVYRRFNSDGTIDVSFGTNGSLVQGLGQAGGINSLAIQPNGKIVAVGLGFVGGNSYTIVSRINADGTITDSFSSLGAGKGGLSVFIQSDGKILVGGRYISGIPAYNFGFLSRFNADGTLETVFSTPIYPVGITVQSNGKILISDSLNGNLAAARYNADFSVDNAFGVNGVGIADFGVPAYGRQFIIQNDGSIVVGGFTGSTENSSFALARFKPNGFLDKSFGMSGKVTTSFGNPVNNLTTLVSTASDGILAVGYTQGANSDFALAKYQAGTSTTSPPNKVKFDFDGDGNADISVFRPNDGSWYLKQSANGFTGVAFGFGTDVIAPADYDGDGKTDVAVFRPSNGVWYIQRSTAGFAAVAFGQDGDIPVPGDFDGDGKGDISVFRPSNGAWYRLNSSSGQFSGIIFGQNGDLPQLADFNGDGVSDIAVFRTSNGFFYWLDSITGQFRYEQFGFGTDIPVLADYDGDGKTDIGVFRNGAWYRRNSSNGQVVLIQFGSGGDVPAVADYDGNGKADIALFRPSTGNWYFQNFPAIIFGASNDKPIPSALR